MARHFDFIVVGKGMMGAAAGRHLALEGANVALVGPDEPDDWKSHDGVYASHYDNGRITRTIDNDPDWALLANRSIARYREIEALSGISFYGETGCLISGAASADFMRSVVSVSQRFNLDAPEMDRRGMAERFPWFDLPQTSVGVFEAKGAGYVNPRALVAAQAACAEKAGAAVICSQVSSTVEVGGKVEVTLRSGEVLTAGRVLVAAGGFSVAPGLLPRPADLIVKARTVLFAQVASDELARYEGMPSWIDEGADPSDHFYLLPPIRYPDGRYYIKIGGDPTDIVLADERAIRAWFRTDGGAAAAQHLRRILLKMMPDLRPVSFSTAPCVTTYTVHGYPYIGFAGSERIALLSGGNGAAAKSSDEIGRLGARLIVDGRLDDPAYTTDFAVHFR
ncbi:MAG: FAD-dependent oxidoreductase [Shinella sp.]|nr:FAD-dependent oxidoreductase [Shinella sp.]